LKIKLSDFFTDKNIEILKIVSSLLARLHYKGYLVGGMVRDLIQGKPNVDMDITVEEDGIQFAKELARELPGKLTIHETFMTATITSDDFLLDIATTRNEYYRIPGDLPQVFLGSFKEDMLRRDFSINALALSLNEENFGEVIDVVGGKEDIQNGLLRVLHPNSFIEDPTRILRGFRFCGRFGYQFDESTLMLLKNALDKHVFKTVSYQRIAGELKRIMEEKNPSKIFSLLLEYSILEILGFPMANKKNSQILLKKIGKMRKIEDPQLFYALFLTWEVSKEDLVDVLVRLELPKGIVQICLSRPDGILALNHLRDFEKDLTDYEIYKTLKIYPSEIFVLLDVTLDKSIKSIMKRFLHAKIKSKVKISGNDIKEMGIEPGIIYGQIFEEIEKLRVEGKIRTKKQEVAFVRGLKK
jgi:tRNA nucleotidyltransferase (CCA-adding enzyme)